MDKKLQYIYKNGDFHDVNGVTPNELEAAIEELKAGTLPVFKYDDTLGELTNDFTQNAYGSIMLDGNLILVLISGVIVNFFVFYGQEENVTSNDHEQFIADADGNKDTTLSDAYNDATVVNVFATETYVSNNKGTKLYRHEITFSSNPNYPSVPDYLTFISSDRLSDITNTTMLTNAMLEEIRIASMVKGSPTIGSIALSGTLIFTSLIKSGPDSTPTYTLYCNKLVVTSGQSTVTASQSSYSIYNYYCFSHTVTEL